MDKYYKTLELENNASKEDVKKAHKRLVKKYHPDLDGGDEEKFKEVQEAYEILTGKQKPKQQQRPQRNPFDGFGDMFNRPMKGKNIVVRLDLTLEEVFTGVKKDIIFDRVTPCISCDGHGGTEPVQCGQCGGSGFHQLQRGGMSMMTMCNHCGGKGVQFSKKCGTCGTTGNVRGEQKIKLTIPRGISDGRNLVLGGVGHGVQGGRNGDVICVVNILDHIDYYREGLNLLRDIGIPVIDMILGTEIEFETLDGLVKVPIPKNCQTDKMFRLKHKGMVEEDGLRGDLLITVKPLIPKKLTDEEIEVLKNLKNKENFKVIT